MLHQYDWYSHPLAWKSTQRKRPWISAWVALIYDFKWDCFALYYVKSHLFCGRKVSRKPEKKAKAKPCVVRANIRWGRDLLSVDFYNFGFWLKEAATNKRFNSCKPAANITTTTTSRHKHTFMRSDLCSLIAVPIQIWGSTAAWIKAAHCHRHSCSARGECEQRTLNDEANSQSEGRSSTTGPIRSLRLVGGGDKGVPEAVGINLFVSDKAVCPISSLMGAELLWLHTRCTG